MDKVYCGRLNAYYGSMLTEHQSEILRLYYDCDMSLAEIAEVTGTSRQAVREAIVRSTDKLEIWEQKLNLIKKVDSISAELNKIIASIDSVDKAEVKAKLCSLLDEIKEI